MKHIVGDNNWMENSNRSLSNNCLRVARHWKAIWSHYLKVWRKFGNRKTVYSWISSFLVTWGGLKDVEQTMRTRCRSGVEILTAKYTRFSSVSALLLMGEDKGICLPLSLWLKGRVNGSDGTSVHQAHHQNKDEQYTTKRNNTWICCRVITT